jgi:hypothetical protein
MYFLPCPKLSKITLKGFETGGKALHKINFGNYNRWNRIRHQGPEPLGLLYDPVTPVTDVPPFAARCLNFLRDARDPNSEMWNLWARKSSQEFCVNTDFHLTFMGLLHIGNLRHGTAGFTSPPKGGALKKFRP